MTVSETRSPKFLYLMKNIRKRNRKISVNGVLKILLFIISCGKKLNINQ